MYKEHRQRFLDKLAQEGASAIIASGSASIRNHDTEYRFRPTSDFYYLTGFREPESVLVLVPERKEGSSVLFLREKNESEETWTGRRLGVEAAPGALGVDTAFPIEELATRLPELLPGAARVVYRLGEDEARDRLLHEAVAKVRRKARSGPIAPTEFIDPSSWLHELRLIKSTEELAEMRKAAAITVEAYGAIMSQTRPGMNESEIDALLEYTFRRRGGTGCAYTNIVAGGANACILHYVENNMELRDGDMVLIDAGAEWNYYACDVSRTYPVNGSFSPDQRKVYEVVLGAEKKAVAAAKPGVSINAIHDIALRELCAGLIEMGLVEGTVDEVVEKESYQPFFMHRTSHWLGLDVHDCGAYNVAGSSRELEPGMTLTVEPGLYISENNQDVEERWRGIGVRIEDSILITESGHEILTAQIPKEVEEVEAACRDAQLETVG